MTGLCRHLSLLHSRQGPFHSSLMTTIHYFPVEICWWSSGVLTELIHPSAVRTTGSPFHALSGSRQNDKSTWLRRAEWAGVSSSRSQAMCLCLGAWWLEVLVIVLNELGCLHCTHTHGLANKCGKYGVGISCENFHSFDLSCEYR